MWIIASNTHLRMNHNSVSFIACNKTRLSLKYGNHKKIVVPMSIPLCDGTSSSAKYLKASEWHNGSVLYNLLLTLKVSLEAYTVLYKRHSFWPVLSKYLWISKTADELLLLIKIFQELNEGCKKQHFNKLQIPFNNSNMRQNIYCSYALNIIIYCKNNFFTT